MSEQLELGALPPTEAELAREAFDAFHALNPKVYDLFERFTLQAVRAGRGRFSAYAVRERIRWYTEIETAGDDFKLNNNFVPYYVRLFEEKHAEHVGFFETRRARADEV